MLSNTGFFQLTLPQALRFSVLILIVFTVSCTQPDRESQWMNIPRDSSAHKVLNVSDSAEPALPHAKSGDDSIMVK